MASSSSSINDNNYPGWIPNLTPRRSPFPLLGNKEKNDDIDHLEEIKNKNSSFEAAGGFLTWEDLWVTVGSSEDTDKAIIQGLNGYAQTLAFGTSAYVAQDDALTTTLTVKESVYYSAMLQLPDSMTVSEKKQRAETTIREMGLQEAMNTRIGGWSGKGLSGGQKRRVSICIEILKRPKLLFLDEPTSGLDSAASYHAMNRIVKLSQQCGMTVIASIHQPSHENCFFGPASATDEFFALNGFPCQSMRNPSDHYLRTINKDFDNDEDIEKGLAQNKPVTTEETINILIESYKSSQFFQQVHYQVSEISKMEGRVLEKGSQASFLTQSFILTRRSFVNMYRDLGYYWLRLGIYVSLCLCIGTMFYDIGHDTGSVQARGAMLMFVASFLTFMSIGGFPSFVEDVMIFGRERLNGHYGVAAFVVGNTFSSIPYLLIISVIPGAIAYYLVGLHKGFEHFIFFVLVIFASVMLVESLMMLVASIVPNYLMGIIIGAGIQGIMILNAGFFRLPDEIPNPFWKYPMYYIGFQRYAIEGLYKNEFEGLSFPRNQGSGSSTITGKEILETVWQMPMGYSKWIDMVILFGMVVLYRLMFFSFIKISEKIKPILQTFLVAQRKQTKCTG
ncbi:hypothetical protein C5167_027178 [Papaver somniferum]|nr:hypothetical protein C5167_027178 [Papaver somniferum]